MQLFLTGDFLSWEGDNSHKIRAIYFKLPDNLCITILCVMNRQNFEIIFLTCKNYKNTVSMVTATIFEIGKIV